MNWNEILPDLYTYLIFPVIGVAAVLLCVLFTRLIQKLKSKTDNDYAHKYLDMLDRTITSCVIATTQTYVESLKKQGAFDRDAQQIALQTTYNNVMEILTDDAKTYLQTALGDLQTYVLNKIEAEVKITKNI